VIVSPTVRGHLRFWWRVLFAGGFDRSTSLLEAETKPCAAGRVPDRRPASWLATEPHSRHVPGRMRGIASTAGALTYDDHKTGARSC
jgi:hypothetical protein